MSELRLEISAIPPSGNNYKRSRVISPRGGKPFVSWYDTPAAEAWWAHVASVAAGRRMPGHSLTISYVVFLRNRSAMADVDNFAKCIIDAVGKAHVIENDRYVDEVHGYRRIDPTKAPLTVIIVRSAQEQLL